MLDGMRKASQGWLGRIVMAVVMGFIILSFAIWGVGDIFRGFGAGKLAQVGDTEVPVETFRNQYQTMLQQLQRQYRRAITNDQARAMGLDRQVLNRIIAEAALDYRVKALGLAMSDADIAKAILTDQTVAGPTGKFDATKFQELLRDNGYTEQSFVREQRRVYLRQEIIDALTANMTVPVSMLDAIHKYRDEARSVDFVVLPATAVGDIADPAPEVLLQYFAARAQSFRAPEYRKVAVLSLSPASITLRIQPVRPEKAEIVEQHAVELHAHQRTTGLLDRSDQTNVDGDGEFLRRRDIDARARHGTFAARGEFLRGDQQHDTTHTMETRIPQRERHVQIEHHRAAAVIHPRLAHAGGNQREGRIRRQVDFHRTRRVQRGFLRERRLTGQGQQSQAENEQYLIQGKPH